MMGQIVRKLENLISSWTIYPLACALVVIGAKCWMIGRYGNPTPYWDQWDAEGANLYPKFFDGTLHFSDLIASHNEHRILITRLWSLLLLELSGYWDPLLQMVANTLLLGAFIVLFVAAIRPILDGTSWIAFAMFSALIFSLPFGWENTLAGFQSQWYFMLLFSIIGLLAIIHATAFTPRWWIALLLFILSFFSLASGVLAAATGFAVCLVQLIAQRRSGFREWLALVILAAMTVAMVYFTPAVADHASLKSHSIKQFLQALVTIESWPVATAETHGGMHGVFAILIQTPVWLTSLYVIVLRPPRNDRRWVLVALTCWSALQAVIMAYGRSASPTGSRYLDIYAIALPLNFACLLYFLSQIQKPQLRRRLAYGAVFSWLILILFGMARIVDQQSFPEMAFKREYGLAETKNLRAYLDTGDIRILESQRHLYIPYPDPKGLAALASMPVIRAILPPALVGDASAARAQQRGLARFIGRTIETFKRLMLRWGILLVPTGFVLFLLGFAVQWRSRATVPPSLP